jgi:hypothetical protein
MRGPHDEKAEEEGGRAAERLREFLAKRLPPGASAEEINAEISKWEKENEGPGSEETNETNKD